MAPPVPIFILDSHEGFWPLAVESVEHAGATFTKTGQPVELSRLPAEGGAMNFPGHPEGQEARLRPRFGRVGYRRVVHGGGLAWHQYWLWYLYNPKLIVDVTGNHEGDWEFVQIGCVGDTPVCMTGSQHRSGSHRMFWDVELRDGRPVVYVAVGSHANFFGPVAKLPWIGDDADGEGEVLDDLEWRDFGPWAAWPGRWGNSTGLGESPQSPGHQGARWHAPHRYHSAAQSQA